MEHGGTTANPVIVPVACPVRPDGAPKLSGANAVRVKPGSRASQIFRQEQIAEEYFCNYEVSRDYEDALETAGLRITGRGEAGEARIVELPEHRFFIATLFQPQLTSVAARRPHPLLMEYLATCRASEA